MTDQGKNTTKIVLAALAIVSAVVTLVLAPAISGRAAASDQQNAILQRLARVEECTRKLDSMPERIAAQTEMISGLRVAVDRLQVKVDDLGKGK